MKLRRYVSAFVAGFNLGTLHYLQGFFFYRNMSEYCLYHYLCVFDVVYFVGVINWYIDLKCREWTT
jgi:hypothetical protein